jgi:Putative restriction endonuclease
VTAGMLDYITLPDRQVWTLEDLLALPDDGHRYEILDGSLVMSAQATPPHQVVANLLAEGLRAAAPAGTSALTDVSVDLEFGGHCPVPDVVVAPSAVLSNPAVKALTPSDARLAPAELVGLW